MNRKHRKKRRNSSHKGLSLLLALVLVCSLFAGTGFATYASAVEETVISSVSDGSSGTDTQESEAEDTETADDSEDSESTGDDKDDENEENIIVTTSLEDEIVLTSDSDSDSCSHSHSDNDSWKAISKSDFTDSVYTISTAGNYYLSEDVEGSITIDASLTVTLCLNGHTLSAPGTSTAAIAIIYSGQNISLTIEDCSGDGKICPADNSTCSYGIQLSTGGTLILNGGTIKGFSGAGIYADTTVSNTVVILNGGTIDGVKTGRGVWLTGSGTTLTFAGVTIQNCCTSGSGGGIYVNMNKGSTATVTMTSGTITGCSASWGGGIYVNRSSFTMSGGSITSNSAEKGGGIFLGQISSFTMKGGTISNNAASGAGGGIYMYSANSIDCGTAEIYAGYITDNTAKGTSRNQDYYSGGGIYVHTKATLTLYNAEISGNKTTASGTGTGALGYGSGIAASYDSAVYSYYTEGAVIYNNGSDSDSSDEIYIENVDDYSSDIYLSDYYLGGGKYDWIDANNEAVDASKLDRTTIRNCHKINWPIYSKNTILFCDNVV